MLLTTGNLDRMGPPHPKNPNRIAIWATEVSIACAQCSKPEPVVQQPKIWKRIFSKNSSSLTSTPTSTPTKSKSTGTTSPLKIPKIDSRNSSASLSGMKTSSNTSGGTPPSPDHFPPCIAPIAAHEHHHHFSLHLPDGIIGHSDEMSRTAMYGPAYDSANSNPWGLVGDWENDNGESSLDMASEESGAGLDARERGQQLARAERSSNTDMKKFRMAAMRQASAVAT